MPTSLQFVGADRALESFSTLIVAGRRSRLTDDDVAAHLPPATRRQWSALVERLKPVENGGSLTTIVSDGADDAGYKLVLVATAEACSHHNSPTRVHSLYDQLKGHLAATDDTALFVALDHPSHAPAIASAIGRALPRFSLKSNDHTERVVRAVLLAPGGVGVDLERAASVAENVRLVGHLIDQPPSHLDTDAFLAVIQDAAKELGVGLTVKRGSELETEGFGGLWHVGKAAVAPPAFAVLSYEPAGATRTVALVGKGIVYDTGGLSIKGKGSMPGMKCDMGGAAAVLGAFRTLVATGAKDRIHAIFCLAENAVGPMSMRPDDIITLYSGKTVEVNNTDAEGRLVVADGVAYAAKHLAPDMVIDLATLTGAQMIATGKRHALAVCNDPELEAAIVDAGKRSGDLVHAMPYAPEFFRSEFKSKVADLKNSAKDRMNALPSCAAQFIAEHVVDFKGPWLHLDIAGPAWQEERGTGYGVALLLELLHGLD